MTSSSMEARVAHVEGIVEEMRSRFGGVESRLDRIESRIDRLDDRLAGFEERMQTQLRGVDARLQANLYWVMAAMFSMGITVVLAIVVRG